MTDDRLTRQDAEGKLYHIAEIEAGLGLREMRCLNHNVKSPDTNGRFAPGSHRKVGVSMHTRSITKLDEAAKAMYELWRTGITGDLPFDPTLTWEEASQAHEYWLAMAQTAFSKFEDAS